MKRKLLILFVAVSMLAYSAAYGATVRLGDPFDKEAQCQACYDNAEEFWRKCVNTVGDEGDAQCRDEAEIYLANCQREFCID